MASPDLGRFIDIRPINARPGIPNEKPIPREIPLIPNPIKEPHRDPITTTPEPIRVPQNPSREPVPVR